MMKNLSETRTWKAFSAEVTPPLVNEDLDLLNKDPIAWMITKMHKQQATTPIYLLAHSLDGINWGRLEGDQLVTSHSIDRTISPELRTDTLQQARLFTEKQEIMIWRVGKTWQGRIITETPTPEDKEMAFDETHLLWGTASESRGDFSILADGSQGLRHIVPLAANVEVNHRMAVQVRHYLTENKVNGIQSIHVSRLVGFELIKEKVESNDK